MSIDGVILTRNAGGGGRAVEMDRGADIRVSRAPR